MLQQSNWVHDEEGDAEDDVEDVAVYDDETGDVGVYDPEPELVTSEYDAMMDARLAAYHEECWEAVFGEVVREIYDDL